MNCVSTPGVSSPPATARAPSHSTNTIAPNTSEIETAVSAARETLRRSALANAASTASA